MIRIAAFVVALVLVVPSCGGAATYYVPSPGYPTIQSNIYRCSEGDTVVVMPGTYHEHDIEVYPTIHLRSETGEADCVTIDALGYGGVLRCWDTLNCSVIEGFTLTGGSGSGLYCMNASATVRGCVFVGNTGFEGAGASCSWCSPTFEDCVFLDNSAEYGAAINISHSTVVVTDCVFSGNRAEILGGAIECYVGSTAIITRCVFSGNSAGLLGGALHTSQDSYPRFVGCTLVGNSAPQGGGVACRLDAQATLENTIVAFAGAGEAVYCETGASAQLSCSDLYGNAGGDWVGCIAGQLGLNGDFSECPLFCDPENADFHLQECSPCAPGNHPQGYECGLIGAWDVACGCGMPSVMESTTWSSLKALYR